MRIPMNLLRVYSTFVIQD